MSSGPIQLHFVAAGKYHDIDFARLEILKLFAEEPRIRATVAMDYANVERLADCSVLVTYTCDLTPTAAQTGALKAFLARGGRWLALHGTNSILRFLDSGLVDSPDDDPEFMALVGTQFVAHPPIGSPFRVEIVDPDHPVSRGLADFDVVDELYLSRPTAPIRTLLQTRFSGEATGFVEAAWTDAVVPVLYLRDHAPGAVLHNTLGHCRGHYDVAVFTPFWPHPERCAWNYPVYYELLRRGLGWAVKELD